MHFHEIIVRGGMNLNNQREKITYAVDPKLPRALLGTFDDVRYDGTDAKGRSSINETARSTDRLLYFRSPTAILRCPPVCPISVGSRRSDSAFESEYQRFGGIRYSRRWQSFERSEARERR